MPFPNQRDLTYAIGTVSINSGDTTVTGAATLWDIAIARQWDWISIDGEMPVPITSMTDASTLEIPAWQGANKASVSYVIYQISPLRYFGATQSADVDNMLAALNTEGWYRFVKPSASDPTAQGIVANEGQPAFQYTTGKLWIMSGGAWVFVGTFKGYSLPTVYDAGKTYGSFDVVTYNGSSYVSKVDGNSDHTPGDVGSNDYWVILASKGDVGSPGTPGANGDDGDDATIAIGTVTTVDYGDPATVTNVGTPGAAVFNFEIPAGQNGEGTGDVVGPAGATDSRLVVFDGATGKAIKDSGKVVGDFATAAQAVPAGGTTGQVLAKASATNNDVSWVNQSGGGASRGRLYGLTLSNNATDATNDIDIATGEAADADGNLMVLASSITKRLDASWAVGSGNGGLDTGSIADGTYHVWLIQRSDTGVVDALFSTSPSAPTMPTNYDRKRRIGAIVRVSGVIKPFYQYGDVFKWALAALDYNSTSTLADTPLALTVPTGINVIPILDATLLMGTAGSAIMLAGDGNNTAANYSIARTSLAGQYCIVNTQNFVTDTAGQIRFSVLNSSGTIGAANLKTHGWIDGRGR